MASDILYIHSTLAASRLIILFSEKLKFSPKNLWRKIENIFSILHFSACRFQSKVIIGDWNVELAMVWQHNSNTPRTDRPKKPTKLKALKLNNLFTSDVGVWRQMFGYRFWCELLKSQQKQLASHQKDKESLKENFPVH
jgi:hypothetical protein